MYDVGVKWEISEEKLRFYQVKRGFLEEKMHNFLVKWWIFEEKMCDFGLHVSFLLRKCVIFRLNGGFL